MMDETRPIEKIIFLYNAHQGKLNAAFDTIHKFVSPGTYQCQLCAMTHGSFGMKKDWKAFIDSLGVEVEFLHHDEIAKRLGKMELALPAILSVRGGQEVSVLVSAEEMDSMKNDPEQLKEAIRKGAGLK